MRETKRTRLIGRTALVALVLFARSLCLVDLGSPVSPVTEIETRVGPAVVRVLSN
jgi:hypothetical protein